MKIKFHEVILRLHHQRIHHSYHKLTYQHNPYFYWFYNIHITEKGIKITEQNGGKKGKITEQKIIKLDKEISEKLLEKCERIIRISSTRLTSSSKRW